MKQFSSFIQSKNSTQPLRFVLFATLLIGLVLITQPAQAELINRRIPTYIIDQSGKSFELSPDGRTIVYTTEIQPGLFSIPIDGENPVNLGIGESVEPGVYNQEIQDFKISHDSQFVVFRQKIETQIQLYSVPIGGGDAIKLNGPLTTEGNVSLNYVISPDGTSVVYVADQDEDSVYELYVTPITGGAIIKLNGPLPPTSDVGTGTEFGDYAFKFSPNGERLVFAVFESESDKYSLFSISPQGGEPMLLNDSVLSSLDNDFFRADFEISPDSQYVIYYADQETADMYELYIVPIEGGTQTKLNSSFISGGDVEEAMFSPDGNHIIYVADQDIDDDFHLYSVPVFGGEVIKLSDPNVDIAYPMHIDSTSKRVVYIGWQGLGTPNVFRELFSVPITGGNSIKLTKNLSTGSTGEALEVIESVKLTADGQTVVYRLDQDTTGVYELYSVPITGGKITKLNPPMVDGGNVSSEYVYIGRDFDITPDNARVIYIADQEIDDVYELFSVPIHGGDAKKMNAPLDELSDVSIFSGSNDFQFSHDNNQIIYVAGPQNEKYLYHSKLTPFFISELNAVALASLPFSYEISADDIDDVSTLSVSAETLPAWLTLVDNGDGTAQLIGTPTTADIGSHEIVLKVTNGDGLNDTQTFTLTVDELVSTIYLSATQKGD
ncbi:MAG: putative Ig domain-containing protein [Anaerolineae bacterium]